MNKQINEYLMEGNNQNATTFNTYVISFFLAKQFLLQDFV